MGILDLAEEAAGAFGADKALEAVDPNANFLEKAAVSAVAFEGVKILKEHLGGGAAPTADQAAPAANADQADGGS